MPYVSPPYPREPPLSCLRPTPPRPAPWPRRPAGTRRGPQWVQPVRFRAADREKGTCPDGLRLAGNGRPVDVAVQEEGNGVTATFPERLRAGGRRLTRLRA